MPASHELIAFVQQVKQLTDNGFTKVIGEAKDGSIVELVGMDESGEIERGLTYLFHGKEKASQYGIQFRFDMAVEHSPIHPGAAAQYLAYHCFGISRRKADELVKAHGIGVIDLIRGGDESCSTLGIDADTLAKAQETLCRLYAHEQTVIRLQELFAGRGFRRSTVADCVNLWKVKAPEIVRKNPYALMLAGFAGCGFKRCDNLYLELGHNPDSLKRQLLCGVDILNREEGDTWMPLRDWVAAVRQAVPNSDPQRAITLGVRSGMIHVETDDLGLQVIASHGRWKDETTVALRANDFLFQRQQLGRIWHLQSSPVVSGSSPPVGAGRCRFCRRLLTEEVSKALGCGPVCARRRGLPWGQESAFVERRTEEKVFVPGGLCEPCRPMFQEPARTSPSWLPDLKGVSPHQLRGLWQATSARIGCFTGGPGTGKTWSLAEAIKSLRESPAKIGVITPYGKAAMVAKEKLNKAQTDADCRTVHSALFMAAREGGRFPYRYIFAEEAGTIPASMMAAILENAHPDARILFVGDYNQLPPIGHGAPFRDMIMSGIPVGRLTEIHRNAGDIVKACKAIADGEEIQFSDCWRPAEGKNLLNVACPETHFDKKVCEVVATLAAEGYDPIRDVQVVVALNEKGYAAKDYINRIVKNRFLPSADDFAVGEKVMNLTNNDYQTAKVEGMGYEPDRSEVRVMNGEIGFIVDIRERSVAVEIPYPRRIVNVFRSAFKQGDNQQWDYAYASTCHKLQGSSARVVVVLADGSPGTKRVVSRQWWTTAISRAEDGCIVIGSRDVVRQQCKRDVLAHRRTRLAERLAAIL